MRRKAQHSNRNFLFGTLVLGILVLGIVIAFTALSYKLSTSKTVTYRDVYHLCLGEGLHGGNLDIYLNDSLIHSGHTPHTDTILTAERMAEDNALIVVDRFTDIMHIVEIPAKRSAFTVTLREGELGIE